MLVDLIGAAAIGYLIAGSAETARILAGPKIDRTIALSKPSILSISINIFIWPIVFYFNDHGAARFMLPIVSLVIYSAIAIGIKYALNLIFGSTELAWALLAGATLLIVVSVVFSGRKL